MDWIDNILKQVNLIATGDIPDPVSRQCDSLVRGGTNQG